MSKPDDPACEMCGDNNGPIHLRARCHMTAPLRAVLERGVLSLYCYVPSCNRLVIRMRVAELLRS